MTADLLTVKPDREWRRKLIDSDQAGRYVELARTWRDGDVIDLPMHVHLAPLLPFHKIANGYYNLYWRIG